MPLTPEIAHAFADRWYKAWNTPGGDIDAVMACYHDDIQHSSPFIARFNGTADDTLRGKQTVRDYFSRALTSNPTPPGKTRFQPLHLTTGNHSVLLVYRRWTGELAGEVFFLNESSLITRSVSHYGEQSPHQCPCSCS